MRVRIEMIEGDMLPSESLADRMEEGCSQEKISRLHTKLQRMLLEDFQDSHQV
jgi:hypothetical protein